MSIWLGISLQAFFYNFRLITIYASFWAGKNNLPAVYDDKQSQIRALNLGFLFFTFKFYYLFHNLHLIPFLVVRPSAEIGKESKNQLFLDSRFESVTQNSDSWFFDSKQRLKKVDSWFTDSKQSLEKNDSRFTDSRFT